MIKSEKQKTKQKPKVLNGGEQNRKIIEKEDAPKLISSRG